MTPEQAMDKLDKTVIGDLEWKIALTTALEKLTPKRVVEREIEVIGLYCCEETLCPACDTFVYKYTPRKQAFCHRCGQKLDWGGNNND